jgi:hypothetical protein
VGVDFDMDYYLAEEARFRVIEAVGAALIALLIGIWWPSTMATCSAACGSSISAPIKTNSRACPIVVGRRTQ